MKSTIFLIVFLMICSVAMTFIGAYYDSTFAYIGATFAGLFAFMVASS